MKKWLFLDPRQCLLFAEIGESMLDDYNYYQIDVSVFNNFIFKRGIYFYIF